ncbi:hypothetical protein OIDMADRAFT_20057 [Oidiodendron maius Zn]|uniref:Uncharacterized protein n=1 Tax=Oidiodendron maius (strain Zn) TaxID=913774 RepID=A0A0C3GQK6_OIDMZ|nr:hypothetical protein OIDMADRAFT_20057 [Oidiodendron maius Zn]
MSESTIVPSSSSNEGSSNGSNSILEERLAAMAKRVEDVQKQNPDGDLKVETQWWVPSVTLGVDLQEGLDKETNNKWKACGRKAMERKFTPDAMAEARSEVKTILAGHPDILERVETLIFKNEEVWASMNKYAESEAAEGRDVFGSCAAVPK